VAPEQNAKKTPKQSLIKVLFEISYFLNNELQIEIVNIEQRGCQNLS